MDVGAADELDDELGACHLVEHMLFRGSERLASGELARRIEAGGGSVNAFTTPDQVVLQATVASRFFAGMAPLLADALLRPRFDEALLATETEVVLEELRQAQDAPGHQLSRAVAQAVWRSHPYRRAVAGTLESVQGLDAARLRAFHRRWFRPERITVVAVGDLDPADARGLLGEAFTGSGHRPERPARRRPHEPAQTRSRCLVREGPFEAARFELAFPGASVAAPEAPLLDLLVLCLGQGRASRLNRAIRLERRLADGLSAGSWAPRDPGLITISGITSSERVLPAVAATIDELQRLVAEPLDEAELARAKACIEAEQDYEPETMHGQARALGYWAAAGGGAHAEQTYQRRVREATVDQLRDVARRRLRGGRLTAGLLLPEGSGVGEQTLLPILDGRLGQVAPPEAAPTTGAAPTSSPGRVHPRSRRHGPVERSLPGGGRIRIEPRGSAPIFSLRLLFPGGLRAETPDTCGLHPVLARCWPRGTLDLGSHELAQRTEALGGSVAGAAGWSSFGLAAGFPVRNLAPALDLFEEILLRPALSAETFEQERSLALEAVRRELDAPGAQAFRRFVQLRYGDHPWGLPPGGTRTSLEALTPEHLRAALTDRLRRDEAVLCVVGDVPVEQTLDRMSALLQALPPGTGPKVEPPAPSPPDLPTLARLSSRRSRAHLVVGFPAPAAGHPDGPALDLVHKLLSGQSGRLFRQLRDVQGLVYEVGSTGSTGVEPGWFAVYLATDPDKIDRARAAVHRELERLVDGSVTLQELDAARSALQGSFEIGMQSYGAVVDARVTDALCGLGWEYTDGFCERLDRVTIEDLKAVARRIIDLSRPIEVVVSPLRTGG